MESPTNLDYLMNWRQGDYFDNAERSSPIWQRLTRRIGSQPGLRTERVVVLSQTCDLQPHKKPEQVAVAPLVDVEGKVQSLDRAKRGEYPRFAHIPLAGDTIFADLGRITSIPIGALRGITPDRGVMPGDEQRALAYKVGRWFSRFPFPDDLTSSVKRFVDKVRSKHGKPESDEGQVFNRLKQVRVKASPNWEAQKISISLIFIVGDNELPPLGEEDEEVSEWAASQDAAAVAGRLLKTEDPRELGPLWWRLVQLWGDACTRTGTIDSIDVDIETWTDFGLAQIANSERLDLDYLSGPALIGD